MEVTDMMWVLLGIGWLAIGLAVGWVFGHMARWGRGEEIEE